MSPSAAPLAPGLTSARARSAASARPATACSQRVLSSEAAQSVRSLAVLLAKTWDRPVGLLASWCGARPVAPWAASPLAVLLSSRGVHSVVAGNTDTQSSVPVMGCPRDEAGEGCAGWAGGGVGPRPLQETRVLRPLTPGYRSGRPEGSEEGQGQQTTRECAGSGASQDGGVQGFWCGTGWGRGPERGGGPRGGLSSQQGRSEGGAGRGGTPQRGPPWGHTWEPPRDTHGDLPGDAGGSGCLRGPPWGRTHILQLSVFRCCSQPHLLTVASHTPCF